MISANQKISIIDQMMQYFLSFFFTTHLLEKITMTINQMNGMMQLLKKPLHL